MKIGVSLALGSVLGFLTCLALFGRATTRQHWRVVERYNAYLRDPATYKTDPETGRSLTTPPDDPGPSLAALVAAGELTHTDLVFPNIPSCGEASRRWMEFCQTHKEIVYIVGDPTYAAFRPSGTGLLHLNIWFRNEDTAVVQALIRELEEARVK